MKRWMPCWCRAGASVGRRLGKNGPCGSGRSQEAMPARPQRSQKLMKADAKNRDGIRRGRPVFFRQSGLERPAPEWESGPILGRQGVPLIGQVLTGLEESGFGEEPTGVALESQRGGCGS